MLECVFGSVGHFELVKCKPLLYFLVANAGPRMEHADGSFIDHLQFCYEYSFSHFKDHSPRVLFLRLSCQMVLGFGGYPFRSRKENQAGGVPPFDTEADICRRACFIPSQLLLGWQAKSYEKDWDVGEVAQVLVPSPGALAYREHAPSISEELIYDCGFQSRRALTSLVLMQGFFFPGPGCRCVPDASQTFARRFVRALEA